MKQFSIIFLIIILLVGCEQPLKREGVHVAKVATAEPDSVAGIDSATWLQLKAELDYFLERHNVQDEGYEMVARYAANPDSACKPQADGTLCAWNIGHWPGIPRNGLGLEHDSCGHIIIGTYENDTLRTGLRIDPQGNYWGDFADGKPNGHGAYRSTDGAYYEGAWKDGLRHGFGFSVAPGSHVRMGEWKDDRYLGERMHYTSERIYGIDISRYQHEKGRKKFTINWKNLRITHLGSLSQKRISGTVDYPVDFCFIKSTEGVSVRNAYYAKDYLAARKAGISVGAYHFFSTKRTGTGAVLHQQHAVPQRRPAARARPGALDRPDSADGRAGGLIPPGQSLASGRGTPHRGQAHTLCEPDIRQQVSVGGTRPEARLSGVDSPLR